MDLSELLSVERIRCQCNVQSRKRALQTLAELLSNSLCAPEDDPEQDADEPPEANGALGSLASKLLKNRPKADEDVEKGILSEMAILDAFIARERLGRTSLDHGFALPHSRIGSIDKPIAALITLEQGIEYSPGDKQPVDPVLGLLVPEECNDEHLKILANLARRFNESSFRENLRNFSQSADLYDYLSTSAQADSS